jgi:hypothetical protein
VKRVISFYRDRGFAKVESELPLIVTLLEPPDKCVLVMVWEVNPFLVQFTASAPPDCDELPTGPVVEIKFGGGQEPDVPGIAANDTAAAEAAREKPDPEYERVKEALFLARIDAANPGALEIEIPADAPAEAKAELAPIAAEFAVRKANVLVYKRHEAELAPILDALFETIEK